MVFIMKIHDNFLHKCYLFSLPLFPEKDCRIYGEFELTTTRREEEEEEREKNEREKVENYFYKQHHNIELFANSSKTIYSFSSFLDFLAKIKAIPSTYKSRKREGNNFVPVLIHLLEITFILYDIFQ